MGNKRQQITDEQFEKAQIDVIVKFNYRRKQKGDGTFASVHEALGILEDELTEFRDEVHAKTNREAQIEELKDIAVGAIWAIASIESGGIDW